MAVRVGCGHQFGQAEIQNLGLPSVGQENVRGLDVPVNDAFGVRGIERVGGLDRGIEQRIKGQRAARDAMLQRGALQQFHGDVAAALIFADFENGTDVGVA